LKYRGKEAAVSDTQPLASVADPPRPALEVADIVRRHGPAFLARHGTTLSATQRRALADVAACRTRAARQRGAGTCAAASRAGSRRSPTTRAARNRHCPKCQGSRTAEWLRREASLLLPADYYHVVFTLPPSVAAVVWQNQRAGYTLLLRAVQQTLRQVAADPRHLGARRRSGCCWCCTPGVRICTTTRTCMGSPPAAGWRATPAVCPASRRGGCRAGRGSFCRCAS
jgi:hypothetical protein